MQKNSSTVKKKRASFFFCILGTMLWLILNAKMHQKKLMSTAHFAAFVHCCWENVAISCQKSFALETHICRLKFHKPEFQRWNIARRYYTTLTYCVFVLLFSKLEHQFKSVGTQIPVQAWEKRDRNKKHSSYTVACPLNLWGKTLPIWYNVIALWI